MDHCHVTRQTRLTVSGSGSSRVPYCPTTDPEPSCSWAGCPPVAGRVGCPASLVFQQSFQPSERSTVLSNYRSRVHSHGPARDGEIFATHSPFSTPRRPMS